MPDISLRVKAVWSHKSNLSRHILLNCLFQARKFKVNGSVFVFFKVYLFLRIFYWTLELFQRCGIFVFLFTVNSLNIFKATMYIKNKYFPQTNIALFCYGWPTNVCIYIYVISLVNNIYGPVVTFFVTIYFYINKQRVYDQLW